MKKKFETIVNNYLNGNLSTFANDLKKLSPHNLLRFLIYCHIQENEIDIFLVEKYISPY